VQAERGSQSLEGQRADRRLGVSASYRGAHLLQILGALSDDEVEERSRVGRFEGCDQEERSASSSRTTN
jgi:hypothetical protein